MRRSLILAAFLLSASAVFGDRLPIALPSSGPTTGGTEVMIPRVFTGPVIVYFGDTPAVSTRPVEGGLIAVTPAHPPGQVRIRFFTGGKYESQFVYTFEGPPSPFARLLLPVLTPPLPGAFGSEFRTELNGSVNEPGGVVHVYGLRPGDEPIELVYGSYDDVDELRDEPVEYLGTPGRFIEVPVSELPKFDAYLRAYDTSRNAETFGTEIPIVPLEEFRPNRLMLVDVPLERRFRRTLRLYASGPTTVQVSFLHGRPRPDRELFTTELTLTGGAGRFQPAYAQFDAFPESDGKTIVRIDASSGGLPVWGFITVTNNDTQQITTITPRQ